MGLDRIGIVGALALAPILFGCEQQDAPPPTLSPAPVACQREAQRLGFTVLGAEGGAEQQPDGSAAYPVLVQWGSFGGAHLRCRIDSAGGVTLG
jgi:hypothetical protein